MTLDQYISSLNQRYQQGNATEHTFRGDLQQLLESIIPDVQATNEPKRQACGAPDYILTKNDIPVGFIEAKDIGDKDLEGTKKAGNKEQFDRYKASLGNIFFTDYLDFHLYRDGQFVTKIAIGEVRGNAIVALPENFAEFTNLLKNFCTHISQSIKSPQKLAQMMADKARLLAGIIEKSVQSDEDKAEDSTLKDQMTAFKEILIHDITPKGFADVYAQTIAYGMFAARLHDPTLPTFSRQEAAELIPKSNPFLRKLFGYIAGPDIDDRIKWIVDSLVEVFLACNVREILKDFGKATKMEDPIIHFYETFLSEYDPALRKARGVWYTPAPVVNFIVRAVDDILKTEFGLSQGLADTSKTNVKALEKDGKTLVEQEIHRVQILDPATGTGTFLAEVVKHVHKNFAAQQGAWSSYVETHLLPRLNGFELLMASYAMAHLQLDLLLTETGYKPSKAQRLRVFLTNSLEESNADAPQIPMMRWLSDEGIQADKIKRNTPVMCVIGNPPYAVSSTNKGKWIEDLTADYKKDMKERNIQPLSDDYIKFVRFGQHFVDKNGSGILAYISNNSFIDGIIHRQMRKHLLESFDSIYILDLHGNSKKKETALDGSADQNVFDIMQGVSINIFVKTGKKNPNELGKVFHYNLFGKREIKYSFLNENTLKSVLWNNLLTESPNYFFVAKAAEGQDKYEQGFSINALFSLNSSGITTERDHLTIQFETKLLSDIKNDLLNQEESYFRKKYTNKPDGRDWKISFAKNDLQKNLGEITNILYRPFDVRYTVYTGKSKGFMAYPREEVMQHLFQKENIALLSCRQQTSFDFQHIFISKLITERCAVSLQTGEVGYVFPLYVYPQQMYKIVSDEQENIAVKLEEALMLLENFQYTFTQIQKMYHAVNEPDAELKKYYKEQEKHLIKLKQNVQKFRQQHHEIASKNASQSLFAEEAVRKPNLNKEIVAAIAAGLGLQFTVEKENKAGTFAPIDILDYIYAVLHSPTYREQYKEFLKIDFPRVPYPKDVEKFWQLVALGGQIRQIHLLESADVERYITQYVGEGSNLVEKAKYQDGKKVYINENQYFDGVPQVAWEFYIGGYQPAQKWLKDRKDRQLSFEDILHYQKIIVALTETDRLMHEIDKIGITL